MHITRSIPINNCGTWFSKENKKENINLIEQFAKITNKLEILLVCRELSSCFRNKLSQFCSDVKSTKNYSSLLKKSVSTATNEKAHRRQHIYIEK